MYNYTSAFEINNTSEQCHGPYACGISVQVIISQRHFSKRALSVSPYETRQGTSA